jgi:SAM-dependent methyltransferase
MEYLYTPDYYEGLKNRHATSDVIVPLVVDLIHPRSVVDIGCGVGVWLNTFRDQGTEIIAGYDGDWIPKEMLMIRANEFTALDMSLRMPDVEGFDLALCLEAAEHLPNEMSEPLVRCLTRSAPAVLFSAAIPGQGGTGHINEQWPWFWRRLFDRAGYVCLDVIRPTVWLDKQVGVNYRQNVFLYVADGHPLIAQHQSRIVPLDEDRLTLMLISEYVLKRNITLENYSAATLIRALIVKLRRRLGMSH